MNMDIFEEFMNKLIEELDIPLFLIKYDNILNEDNLDKITEYEDLSIILKLLKYKLILINEKKAVHCTFNIEKLFNRIPENDLILLHNILLHSLIIHPSTDIAVVYLYKSCNFLNNNLKDKSNSIILHHLEIIDAILELLILSKYNIKELDKQSNLAKLLLYLISNDENNIRRKITVDIIPKYITFTQNYSLFPAIWEEIKNSALETYSLLALEKYFIPRNYNEIFFNILNIEEFWFNLQKNICNSDPIIKKQSYYLLKKSVQTLLNNESYINKFISKLDIIKWESDNFEEYRNAWKNFFILCEVSNEKQIHLVEPVFRLYNSLKLLHSSWRNSVTKLYIFHPHSAVVRLTIINILKGKWNCAINVLIQGLNNNFLYENCLNSDFMSCFNAYVSSLNQKEYLTFINEICNNQMSPVPFYHTCKTLAVSDSKDINLKILIHLIKLNEKIPHLYIRKGILHFLFLYFTKILTNVKLVDGDFFLDFVKTLYLFHSNNYLQRGNCHWQQLLKLLLINKNIYQSIISIEMMNEFCLLSKEYSVFVIILIDSNILNPDWIHSYFRNILETRDETNKLDYFIFLFNTMCVMSKPNEICEESILSYQDYTNIFNELFNICNNLETKSYTLEFFDAIEFICDNILDKIFLNKNFCELFTLFLNKLQKEQKFLCYMILSKKIIQAYELNLKLRKINCKEELLNLSSCLKNMKLYYDIELKNTCNENNLKQKLFLNYYYTKLTIINLLIIMDGEKQIEECNIFEKINNYYDKGGLDIITLVIDTLGVVVSNWNLNKISKNLISEFLNLLIRCQKDIFNLRTNELFRPAITKFISTILHPQIFQHDILKEYVNNFCLSMFDSSQIITGIRNEILHRIRMCNLSPAILIEGLLCGQILRKDQRIEFETCNMISQDIEHLNLDINNPCQLDGKVRSKSVALLLSLMYKPYKNFNVTQFCDNVLKLLIDKYNKSAGKRYFGDSQIHLMKLRILQSLHLIVPKLMKDSLNATANWLLDCLVNESQQPSIKILIQWLIIRIYSLLKEKEKLIHKLISQASTLKGTSCTSIFPLLYHAVKDKTVNISSTYDCMKFLLPYTMGQQFSVRFSAQVTIQRIYEVYSNEPEFSKTYESIYNTITDVINQTATDKLNDSILSYINLLPTLQAIYYDIPRLSHVTQTEWLPVDYFTGIIQMKLRSNNELQTMETNVKRSEMCIVENYENMNVQKKIEPMNLTEDTTEIKNSTGHLIVVACLIDKAPNLGGLSRTCEVFGVKQYVLNNIQFMKNKEYQSLSMSSEKWIDTLEVKIENLPSYLLDMKKKNYKIIGAEQTLNSKKLGTFRFDKNSLLLLGNEKEGIPPNLIHLLDECIEISQFGQIRSLNVHVAGALFIWEYVKQHCVTV